MGVRIEALLNCCFHIMVLEKTLGSSLDRKEIKPVNSKGNQPWIFIGRTVGKDEALILWSPDGKGQLIGEDPDAGKDWGQEEKGVTEDEMVRWHHWLSGHESEQSLGYSERQGSLASCNPWGHKELNATERLNNNNYIIERLSSVWESWHAKSC